MVMVMAVIGGLIGGGIGYAVNDFMGFLGGMVIGMIPLMVIGLVLKGKKDAETKGIPTLPNLKATLEQQRPPAGPAEAAARRRSVATPDGPGRYKIEGVVKSTGGDIKTYVDAASRANAKVKAELKGIVVTAIERVEGS